MISMPQVFSPQTGRECWINGLHEIKGDGFSGCNNITFILDLQVILEHLELVVQWGHQVLQGLENLDQLDQWGHLEALGPLVSFSID